MTHRVGLLQGIGVDKAGSLADSRPDPELLRLENMDTDLRPLPAAIEATQRAVERDEANSYLPFHGSLHLRQVVCSHIHTLSGVQYEPESNCIITAGGCNGILVVLLALLEPGDIVLTLDPIYVGLLNRIRLAGGEARFLPCLPEPHGWRVDTDRLAEFAGKGVKAVLAMSPAMPCGAVMTRSEWEKLARFCCEEDAWLINNAALERILYDGHEYFSPLTCENVVSRTLTVGTASKECCMIGWRVGWVAGPGDAMERVKRVAISDVVTPVGIAQDAAAAALGGSYEHLPRCIAQWDERRRILLDELKDFDVIRPGGGWTLLVDVSPLGLSSEAVSHLLFEKAKVATTPMIGWGSERTSRYIRLVFANEPAHRLRGIGERFKRALRQR